MYNKSMTIYALSSGPGVSGIAVIRISGKKTSEVIRNLTNGELPPPRVATLKKINNINTSELIDEGIILWFPAQIATQEKIWPNCMFMEYLCNKFNKGNFKHRRV